MNRNHFRRQLDLELKDVKFSAEGRKKVLECTRKQELMPGQRKEPEQHAAGGKRPWVEKLSDFLEMELRIPIKPLVAVLFIVLSGLIYSCIEVAGVSAEEMEISNITVLDGNNGGQWNGIDQN